MEIDWHYHRHRWNNLDTSISHHAESFALRRTDAEKKCVFVCSLVGLCVLCVSVRLKLHLTKHQCDQWMQIIYDLTHKALQKGRICYGKKPYKPPSVGVFMEFIETKIRHMWSLYIAIKTPFYALLTQHSRVPFNAVQYHMLLHIYNTTVTEVEHTPEF